MFNVIEKEMAWRRSQGISEGFETLRQYKPVVAAGPKEPLGGQMMMADYYRKAMGFLSPSVAMEIHISTRFIWKRH